jgi:hypothetical protein
VTEGTREQGHRVGGISRFTAAWFAWAVYVLSLVLTAFGLLFVVLDLPQPDTRVYGYWVENTIVALTFSVVGGVVASRRPAPP